MIASTVHILLVEDDQVDAEAIKRSFLEHKVSNPIRVVEDGRQALDVLRGQSGEPPFPRPFLILLDLHMPWMNGIEFLGELRRDPDLRASIVFVLTASDADRDKAACYGHNVVGYIVKSGAGGDFIELATMLSDYWRVVEFPPEKAG